jgi:hypothetical protein
MDRDRIIKIKDMMAKIKDKQIFKEIFYIAQPELQSTGDCKYSHNHNGIFFDLKVLSDEILIKIESILKKHINNTESENHIDTINYSDY